MKPRRNKITVFITALVVFTVLSTGTQAAIPAAQQAGYHNPLYSNEIDSATNGTTTLEIRHTDIELGNGQALIATNAGNLTLDAVSGVTIPVGDDLQLGTGQVITAFTDDGTLGGSNPSSSEVPSERAIREYLEGIQNNVSEKQDRVNATCPAGQSIRFIAENGSVTCEVDTDTTYTDGAGVGLAGTQFFVEDGNGLSVTPSNDGLQISAGTCDANDEVLLWTGTSWACGTDDGIYTAGAGLSLSGNNFSISAPTCTGSYDKLLWDGSSFSCGTDQDTQYTAGQGIGISGTTFGVNGGPGLSATSTGLRVDLTSPCGAGELLTWDGTNFVCTADDQGPTYAAGNGLSKTGNTFNVNTGDGLTISSDDVVVTAPNCPSGQHLTWNGGWGCEPDDVGPTYSAGAGVSISSGTVASTLAGQDCSPQVAYGVSASGNLLCKPEPTCPVCPSTSTYLLDCDGDDYTVPGTSVEATSVTGSCWTTTTDGDDCADGDSNTNPSVTSYKTSPGGNGFDYNCKNGVERQYTTQAQCTCAGGNIDWSQTNFGWSGSIPNCGVKAQFVTEWSCSGPSTCDAITLIDRTQGCR